MVKPYFEKPYIEDREDDRDFNIIITCSNCGGEHTIHRFLHGLLHSLRQGFLALKIVDILTEEATPTSMIHELNKMNNFRFRIQALASFINSGPLFDDNGNSNNGNNRIEDMVNFNNCMIKSYEFGSSLLGTDELNMYPKCLDPKTDSVITRIVWAATYLDQRRISVFDKNEKITSERQIKAGVSYYLFDTIEPTHKQKLIIDELWRYEGKLLVLSGIKLEGGYNGKFAYNSRHPTNFVYQVGKLK